MEHKGQNVSPLLCRITRHAESNVDIRTSRLPACMPSL